MNMNMNFNICAMTMDLTGNKNKVFGWRETDRYTILDLGTMPNAIVIKMEEQGYKYLISLRSYFSFPDNYYDMRFETEEEAIKKSCDYLSQWLLELNSQLFNTN
jgi:hypothetical protein